MNNSFAAAHPELVCEWSEKNLPLMPDKITYGSNKIVWWKANCGHEWQTSVKSRSAGEKCPICSGARVVEGINDLATLKPELARQWSKKNKLKPTQVSLGSHKKVIWKCKHGHEWEASVKSRAVNGTGCPYCSHNKILAGFNDLASQYPEIAAEWSERNHPLEPTMVTAFANRKVWWKCSKGHEWNTLISTRSGGSKCPYCSGILLLKGFNDFATMHPSFAEEWSERNLPLTPDMVNGKSRKNVCWKCKVCGFEWKSLVQSRVKGTVCPVCADRAVLTGYNDLATTDTYLLQEWDYERNIEDVSSRVEWCACFVSWCANECGYIDTGVIPKFAGCINGVQWFKDRGQWADNSIEPTPGMIIFFDWNNPGGSSGPQDGQADHVGIVEKCENGIVYTVEGNSGDSCRQRQYPVGYYEILGYGILCP